MTRRNSILIKLVTLAVLAGNGCNPGRRSDTLPLPGTYGFDASFLRKYAPETIELADAQGTSKVLLSPRYQGRVMTSTAAGDSGISFGWINYELISAGTKKKQFNPVGGEERFWLGPEGGQFSLYFHPGDSFNITNWQVPALIDTLPWGVLNSDSTEVVFGSRACLTNYSGTVFIMDIERVVTLMEIADIESRLNLSIPENVGFVGYTTTNTVANSGPSDWKKETGLPSIWLLGMMTPTDHTVAIIPFSPRKDARALITTNYFGDIPSDRLSVGDSVLLFTCDGKYRSKIGLPPSIAKPLAASFDFKKNTLTIISFDVVPDAAYVNSKWEFQKDPYLGDVVNSYNDGPLEDGSQLGPFYELESSSPALQLKSGESRTYRQTTVHLTGDFASLQNIAGELLGVNLTDIRNQFQ